MKRFIFAAMAVGLLLSLHGGAQTAQGATYYVNYGASGGGTGWGDAYGSILSALNAIDTADDTSATIKVGLTTGGNYYGASSKTIAYASSNTTADISILGGWDPNTDTVTGVSNIGGTGMGLSLMVSGGAVGNANIGNITIRDFNINTSGIGLNTNASTNNSNYVNFAVYDSTLSTSSLTSNVIRTSANGGKVAGLLLDNTDVSTPVGSVMSAIYGSSANAGGVNTFEVRNGSTITAAADGSGNGKNGAAEVIGARLVASGATTTITNTGAGWGAYVGNTAYGPYGHSVTDVTITSTGGATGGGLSLVADDFSPSAVASVVSNVTITTGGGAALRLYGWHGSGSDANATDVAISNATLTANGAAGIALYIQFQNGGISDVDVTDSTLHGGSQAVYLAGGGGNRGADTLDFLRSTLSAGAADGSTNSASPVVQINTYDDSTTMTLDRTIVRNGAGGVLIAPVTTQGNAFLTMINSVITDQTGYGVQLDAPGNSGERLTATNSTFSDLGGPAAVFGDNGTSTILEAILNYVAFVLRDPSATIFENLDANRQLALIGDLNAFYEYLTYFANTGGGGLNDTLTSSLDAPAGDAMLDADGYHLLAGSPLANQYTPSGGDPLVDIEGDIRPDVTLADIGADEAYPVPEPATLGLLAIGGAGMVAGAFRRRRRD
ncbi:MAG: hypothetical protein BIFFINMI_01716 [Phycisphaerae bacterium]|nr:hypothetical protein [Phycisphaerae bacterium]